MSDSSANKLFDAQKWNARLPELSSTYQKHQPFPNIELSGFLDEALIQQVVAEFPKPSDTNWIQYKHINENKLGKNTRSEFPPLIGQLIDELNSDEFVAWLSELTGIAGLRSDASLEGGGMHQTETGGFLNVHADFITHHHHKHWIRKCNLILYLNPGWDEAWGGGLELWDKDMQSCVKRIPPFCNRALIFNTGAASYHGYPDPIQCPADTTRKSLALYYYVVADEPVKSPTSTNYQARPGEGLLKRLLIWLDNKALGVYSWAKKRFGLSDGFASRVLATLFRKNR